MEKGRRIIIKDLSLKMNWSNLKQNKCPECNKEFGFGNYNRAGKRIVCDCGFTISEKNLAETVARMVGGRIDREFQGRRNN